MNHITRGKFIDNEPYNRGKPTDNEHVTGANKEIMKVR